MAKIFFSTWKKTVMASNMVISLKYIFQVCDITAAKYRAGFTSQVFAQTFSFILIQIVSHPLSFTSSLRSWLTKISTSSTVNVNWYSCTREKNIVFSGARLIYTRGGSDPDQTETQLKYLSFTWSLFTPHIIHMH